METTGIKYAIWMDGWIDQMRAAGLNNESIGQIFDAFLSQSFTGHSNYDESLDDAKKSIRDAFLAGEISIDTWKSITKEISIRKTFWSQMSQMIDRNTASYQKRVRAGAKNGAKKGKVKEAVAETEASTKSIFNI